jgi:L-malate glycosyltransferase
MAESKMKKILLIANIRKHQGGITTQVFELADSLRQEGLSVEIISTHGSVKERFSGILKAYSSARNCGLIISAGCSYYGFFPMVVASLIARIRRKKIIYNFHDGQVEDFLRKYYGIVKLLIGSEIIIVATDFLKKSFEKFGFNAIRISNHFNVINNNPGTHTRYEKLKIMWARSFEKLYDPETAIKAAIHFKDNPNIKFHFYGTGKYLNHYKEEYEKEKIDFFGHVNREELLIKYADYDVFLNTSLYDNFPMSIIEAGINRLIVISSKTGGIPTIYGENEIIFYEPGNKEDLIVKIYNVLNNPEIYRSYADRLHERVLSFSWNNVKTDWMELINNKFTETVQ